MKRIKSRVLLSAGIIIAILGVIYLIPALISEAYWTAIISTIILVCGLVLLAIALGGEK